MLSFYLTDSLQKVFSTGVLPPERGAFSALKDERVSFQAVLLSDEDLTVGVTAESDLSLRLYEVREMPAGYPVDRRAKNCTLLRGGAPGNYPDLLVPLKKELRLEAGKAAAVWVEARTDIPGGHSVTVTAAANGETQTKTAAITASATPLAPQTLFYTDWFHADCLARYYDVEVFSEEHWAILDRFIGNAAEYGVNLLLTPLFTPALDTAVGHERPTVQLVDVKKRGDRYEFSFERLRRWVELCRKHGIGHFEFSHFFTQWGAEFCPKVIADTDEGVKRIFGWDTAATSPEYVAFLRALGKELKAFTDETGITDNCFVHVSDEPGDEDIPQYRACAAVIKEAFGAYRHLDALSHLDFYRLGLVQIPVPSEGHVEEFAAAGAKDLWTYYCCGQYQNELPNRFFAMPSVRNRILGALLYRYACAGFLHWGFNFYFSQLSLREIDPFTVTDAGGAFPSGDSFTVYPGEDGEPLPSLREKVFYEGLQDLRALQTLEKKIGREETLALLEDTLGKITFSSYPMDETKILLLRERINEKLA
ncbi:MAG: DUF4091 domain-containing protein [Clostridia bacterium]|nr:DUF4091 domain-containing protein [Clostridia bacterium]